MMKKTYIGIGLVLLVIILGVVFTWFGFGGGSNQTDDERVVYVRAIEGSVLGYTATLDDVRASLADSSVEGDPNRVIASLSTIPVANSAVVTMKSVDDVDSAGDLQTLLQEQPQYTNQVFTVVVEDGAIVRFTEETLEE